MPNENKMNLLWTCCGAAGGQTEITAPEIDKICKKCGHKLVLIDGRGFINSGTHSFVAKCPECGEKEKFEDYLLWKKLWGECVGRLSDENKQEK